MRSLFALLSIVLLGVLLAPAKASAADRPLVVIGVAGLTWEDISARRTPTLWRLLQGGAAAGAATIASADCPGDGWLSLSAGRAAVAPRDDQDECRPMPKLERAGADASVTGWPEVLDAQSASDYAPSLGLLAKTLDEAGTCAEPVGPGAALALADGDGVVRRYRPKFTGELRCPVTIIDGGEVTESAEAADRSIATVLEKIESDATVLIQTVSGKRDSDRPELGVTLVTGRSYRLLTTRSTRWDGVVRMLDLPNTILRAAAPGAESPAEFSGTPIVPDGPRPASPARTVRQLAELTKIDHMLRDWSGTFLWVFGIGQFALFGAVLLIRMRRRSPYGRLAGAVTATLASVPVSAFLITLSGWWRTDYPGPALTAGITVLSAMVGVLACLIPAKPLWRSTGAISLFTFAVLLGDALTGTMLHKEALLGPSAIFGGRYYGFGNPTFAIFAVAALVLAGTVASELIHRAHRRMATAAVLLIGGAATVTIVWPSLGANVGGGLATLPGVAVLAFGVAGIRPSGVRLALAGAAGLAIIGAIGVIDWMRPPAQRAHAGQFVQTLIDGEAWQVIGRKIGFALNSLGSGPISWINLAVLVFIMLALARSSRLTLPPLEAARREWPLLPRTVGAVLTTAVAGAAVNDYGIRVVTFAFLLLVPLLAHTLTRATPESPTPATDPPPTPQPPARPPLPTPPTPDTAATPDAPHR